MSYNADDPAERERRRWIKPNAYLWVRQDIHRFMRPDADRFFHPSHQGQKPWYEQPEYISPAMRVYAEKPASPYGPDDPMARANAAAAEAERRAFEAELAQLRANHAELQRQILAQRQALALLRGTRKAGFDPNQPRVPAGNPDGGQWTDGDGLGGGGSDGGDHLLGKPVRLADAGSRITAIPSDVPYQESRRSEEEDEASSERTSGGALPNATSGGNLLAAGKRQSEAYCWNQLQIDNLMCASVIQSMRRAPCRRQAMERYANCLTGKPLPPLIF